MARALTTVQIARLWADAFKKHRPLSAWAEEHFTSPFALSIGADMRRPPDEKDAPFITIFADSVDTGPQRQSNTHSLGLMAGIVDEEFVMLHGVREMRGLVRLDELWLLLQSAMSLAVPGSRMQECSVEFEIVNYPLLLLLVSVTVEESLPIGRK